MCLQSRLLNITAFHPPRETEGLRLRQAAGPSNTNTATQLQMEGRPLDGPKTNRTER